MKYKIAILNKNHTINSYIESIFIGYAWVTRRNRPIVRTTINPSYILKFHSKELAQELAQLIHKAIFPEKQIVVVTEE